jgi:sugar/nucleoside kinase (ribokinase family)
MHEVYAYGMIAPSTVLALDDAYPRPSGYAELAGVFPSIGGEAASSAYVMARLGIGTKLSGNRLGTDEASAGAIGLLSSAGVDCSAIRMVGESPSVTEVVIAAGESRTVFGTYRKLAADRAWDRPSEENVHASRIVCVDPFFGDESLQVVRWCEDSRTPFVTVDASPDSAIARLAEVLIISEEFATRTVGALPGEVLAAFTEQCRGLVILTRGGEPLLFGHRGEHPREYPPFDVTVSDTTGAGDSFRAGIIYGMLRGYDTERVVRTASAVAALVCQQMPGVLNSPTERELEAFLALHP